jgi:hypothetical protein
MIEVSFRDMADRLSFENIASVAIREAKQQIHRTHIKVRTITKKSNKTGRNPES